MASVPSQLFYTFFLLCALMTATPSAKAQYALPTNDPTGQDSIRVVSITTNEKDRQLMINFNKPINEKASLSLFNLHGTEVQRTTLESNKEIVRLDLSELPEGMYVAVISGEEVNLSQYVFKEF
ncbi:MAG: T9SS type A sorting domain-containing protein [Bacteroidota bacterium]